jgi:hypothetical protein
MTAVAFCLAGGSLAHALSPVERLTGSAVVAEFSGKALTGLYRDGEHWNETYNADHTLDYSDPRATMTGTWMTSGNTFCTFYNEADTGGCFEIKRIGSNCYEFVFVTRSEEEARTAPSPTFDWDARGWRTEAPATCEDGLTS